MVINELQIRRRVQIIFFSILDNLFHANRLQLRIILNLLESRGFLFLHVFYKFSNICDLVKNNRLEGLGNGQGGY